MTEAPSTATASTIARKLYVTTLGLAGLWAALSGIAGILGLPGQPTPFYGWPERMVFILRSLGPLLAIVLLNRWWRWLRTP